MPPGNRITAFIDANPRGFRRGISQAEKSLKGFKRSVSGLLTTAGVVALARGLDQITTNAARAGDSIGKAAKVADISATSLQQYRFAAILTGSSQKELDDAVGRFTRRLGEARRGNKAYQQTFRELGVEIEDTNEQAISKIFRSLADVEDVTVRTSLATKVFGDDARRMALLVRDGADGLGKLKRQASESGAVLRGDLVAGAERANDKLSILELQLSTKLNTAVLENIDGLVRYKKALNDVQVAFVQAAAAAARFTDFSSLDVNIEDARRRRVGRQNAPAASVSLQQVLDAVAPVDSESNGAPQPFSFRGRIPNAPSLRSDALARNAERAGEEIRRIVEETRSPLEELEARLASIEALAPFAQTAEESEALTRAVQQALKDISSLEGATDRWRIASERAGEGIAQAFAGAIAFGDDLGKTLERLARQLAFEGLLTLFRSAIGLPGGGAGIFGGARADGGPVQAGRAFLVGERGPELFVPGRSGNIIPNEGFGGGVNVNIVNRFDVGLEAVEERIAEATPAIAAGVVDAFDRQRTRPRFA